MRARTKDLMLAGCLLLLSGYIWHETASYPVPSGDAMVEGLGPGFFPRVLAVTLAGLACLVAAAAFLVRPQAPYGPAPAPSTWGRLRAATLVSMLLAYWLLMPFLGYPLATFAALVALMTLLVPQGLRRRPATFGIIAACAAVATAGVYYLFTGIVKVAIPMGTLFGN